MHTASHTSIGLKSQNRCTKLAGEAGSPQEPGIVTYGELVAQLPLAISHDDHRLSFLLDEISTEEDSEGRGFLTALVVHQDDWMPGADFFTMARRCCADVNNEEAFYMDAFNHVVEYWRAYRN